MRTAIITIGFILWLSSAAWAEWLMWGEPLHAFDGSTRLNLMEAYDTKAACVAALQPLVNHRIDDQRAQNPRHEYRRVDVSESRVGVMSRFVGGETPTEWLPYSRYECWPTGATPR